MLKKILIILTISVFAFSVSCQRKKESVEEKYLSSIESEYSNKFSSNNYTIIEDSETDIIISTNQLIPAQTLKPATTIVKKSTDSKNTKSEKPVGTFVIKKTGTSKNKDTKKITVNTFYSPWTSVNDHIIIKEIRVMIANQEYKQALNYINNLDFNNLPAEVDIGQVYQFKGIVNYFLSKNDKNAMQVAVDSFRMVEGNTKIAKFKPLSLLWNGMLYQTYSTSEADLNEAVALFDRVINEYPRTRFVNDAMFYKALTLKKLGYPVSEYRDILLAIKQGGFVDTLIYSQTVNDYVNGNTLVDKTLSSITYDNNTLPSSTYAGKTITTPY